LRTLIRGLLRLDAVLRHRILLGVGETRLARALLAIAMFD